MHIAYAVEDCGPLSDPLNGMVDTSGGTTFTSVATYSCMVNYQLVGTSMRECGADGEWTDEEPTCECKSLCTILLYAILNLRF